MAYRTDKNLRAGLYVRVSTEDRGQDPETQLRPLREYAERRGFVVVGEFVDHASGTTETRPQYQKLLEVVRKRGLDVVLVWRYDRFARSTRALVNALGEFKARRVAFISYQENVDTTTPQGELVFGMMANLAQFESALIGERVKAGMARAKAQGKRTSRPPIPEATRRKIAELHAQGASIKQIAKRLEIAYGTAWNYIRSPGTDEAHDGHIKTQDP
jgi:DNA invertase Pin-like site-specific DNA recombinase